MRKKYLALIFSLFLLDRISKEITRTQLPENFSIPVIKGVFHLTYITNTGIAFGLAKEKNIFFLSLNILILSGLVAFFMKAKDKAVLFAAALIAAGAAGNIFDRIFYGSVVDFLDFRVWPIFNFADSFVTIGAVILFWREFILPQILKRKNSLKTLL
ncbi:MAG: signal peptidase II [Elusimicrobia bacterium]|nr:signal peptidase II [Elusimicrobiota bacterium]